MLEIMIRNHDVAMYGIDNSMLLGLQASEILHAEE